MTFLTEPQRRTVFDKVISLVDTKFSGADVDVSQLRDVHGPRVVGSRTLEDFEQALDGLLRDLKTSHTGFFHEARPRSAGRIAMAATLTKANTAADGQRWVFQDVHPGGVAAAAGIGSGDRAPQRVPGQPYRPERRTASAARAGHQGRDGRGPRSIPFATLMDGGTRVGAEAQ